MEVYPAKSALMTLLHELTLLFWCSHFFNPGCLTPWLQRHGSCPVCSVTEIIEDRTFTGAVVLETNENGDITTKAIGRDDILAAYDEAPEALNDEQIDDIPV